MTRIDERAGVVSAGLMEAYSVSLSGGLTSTGIGAFGVFLMIVGVLAAWGVPRLFPDIALSPDGVFAYLKGKPWRFIAWREMESITKGHDRSGKPSLRIKGPRYTIQVGGRIDRFADLSECVARYARDHSLRQRPWGDWSKVEDIAEL
jgi:hypothetical protein